MIVSRLIVFPFKLGKENPAQIDKNDVIRSPRKNCGSCACHTCPLTSRFYVCLECGNTIKTCNRKEICC